MLQEYILSALKIMPERFEYIKNKKEKPEKFAGYYEFDDIMKKSIMNELEELLKLHGVEDIKITVHVQQGNEAYIPWIGFHYINNDIDSNPQTGIYITILFKADGSGIVLSLQNGTEDFNQKQICEKTDNLKLKYKMFINKVSTFSQNELNLKGEYSQKKMSRCEKYEKASILAKEYNQEQINKNNCDLEKDLINLIDIYKNMLDISYEELYQDMNTYVAANKYEQLSNKTPTKRKEQKTIKNKINNITKFNNLNRDETQGKIALIKANFKCEYNINHVTFLNDNNDQFMHKHHLIPMEYYFDFENNIDDHNNIYSLCPICHSQIHYGKSKDQKVLIEKLFEKRKKSYEEFYNLDIKKLFELYGINE